MLCETDRGCPVGDIAPNPKAERLVHTYIRAKYLQRTTGIAEAQTIMLRDVGLLDDYWLLSDFEGVWLEYLEHMQKERNNKAKAKKGPKRRGRRK